GKTRSIPSRIDSLQKLKRAIVVNEQALCTALAKDLGKPELEAVISETAIVIREIEFTCRHLQRWAAPQKIRTSLLNYPSKGVISCEPLGIALIIAPWNYPSQLIFSPLVGALAAGNCALLKPSELAMHTSTVVSQIIADTFDPDLVCVVEGGAEVSQALLKHRFDIIFFTGSTRVGRLVAQAAAQYLTPVVLELGGKSPAIVDVDADLTIAARRIVWGKFFNAGQTCVAPDYLLVHNDIKQALLDKIVIQINQFYGSNPKQSPDFARIINATHFERLTAYLTDGEIITGGETDRSEQYLAPTILDKVSWQAPIMQEEIFGPILPVLSFTDEDDVSELVERHATPLALYYFSKNRTKQRRVMTETAFGGGCLNDTIVHLTEHHLPFGGIGTSGQGSYHGMAGFKTFSHCKSLLHRGTWIDLPLRYPPYDGKLKWLKK
ncbi:MAG: aldehyde dehydrogenase, partial [Deltaproteobacteria bacterium]|nr:aldehyde dehydrogenase [Deltaproteobacteria bacterium]